MRVAPRVADKLRGGPGKLTVGEPPLELLQRVAGNDAASQVQGQAQVSGVLDEAGDDVLHWRVPEVGIGAAAQVVVEVAVADRGDRGGGEVAAGGEGEGEPRALGGEDAVKVPSTEEIVRRGAGAAHRLLVGLEEAGSLPGAGLAPRNELDCVSGFEVAPHLTAVAGPAFRRQRGVGNLNHIPLGGAGQRRRPQPVTKKDAEQPRPREIDGRRIEGRGGLRTDTWSERSERVR